MPWLLALITLTCAFLVGYAIRRGSICAVLATRALILEGKPARFRAFLVAAAGSGAIIVPLHWAMPDLATLSAGYPVTRVVLLGGAAFGVGAWINGACALGTLAHLTGGHIRYLATVVGMVSGALVVQFTGAASNQDALPKASPLEAPDLFAVLFVVVLALCLAIALYRRVPRWWRGFREPGSARMGPYRSMLAVGIFGGLLYALAGNWTYMAILSERAARLVDPTILPSGWPALFSAMAVIFGGVTAAVRYGDFAIQRPRMIGLLRSLAGGMIMGASAAIIPGGNGTLLIHGLPSLAPHAIAAYAAMTAVLCICFGVIGWLRRPSI
ncbi:YeeE/YedE thiosulfate transporter family protein [Phaeobacter italicus]|uniref:YeeE/YedE thiosulfate transporter family protein n=1 Tax=Phaeobacter italicus TaxID=481446 RepID=UPI0035190179